MIGAATAPRDEQRAFLAGAIGAGAVHAAGAALTLANAVVLARVLGEAGFGAYVYATTWVLLLTHPASFGVAPLITRELAGAIRTGEHARVGALRSFAARVTATSTLAVLGTAAIVLLLDPPALGANPRPLLWLALPVTALSAAMLVARHWLLGLRAVVLAQVAESVLRPALVLGCVGLAWASGVEVTALFALAAFGAATAVGVASALVVAARMGPWAPAGPADPAWLRASAPLLVTAVTRDLNAEASVLVMGSLLSPADVGLFRAASRLASLPTLVLTAMNVSLQPVAAGLAATGDMAQLERLGVRASRIATALSLPALLVFFVAGGPVLSIFGPGFAAAAPALAILSLGHLFNVACGSVGVILVAGKREADVARGFAASCVLSLGLSALLVPAWGLVGAALASASALVAWNLALTWVTWRRLGIVPAAVTWRRRSS
jgi:O-antigen/teichoic acid export membrane protein